MIFEWIVFSIGLGFLIYFFIFLCNEKAKYIILIGGRE
jgi:hypothetical protein